MASKGAVPSTKCRVTLLFQAAAFALLFEVGGAAAMRLSLYDVLGRVVAVLADGSFEAGRHEVVLDGAHLPSGVYVLRATVADETGRVAWTFTQGLTLLK